MTNRARGAEEIPRVNPRAGASSDAEPTVLFCSSSGSGFAADPRPPAIGGGQPRVSERARFGYDRKDPGGRFGHLLRGGLAKRRPLPRCRRVPFRVLIGEAPGDCLELI